MFCVIYRVQVKPGSEKRFEEQWHRMTALIYEHQGSLGSRLHRSGTGETIAYAQWPDRVRWQPPLGLPDGAEQAREGMRDCCDAVEVLFELEVVDDHLRGNPFEGRPR